MYCKKCGQTVLDNEKFCSRCGGKIERNVTTNNSCVAPKVNVVVNESKPTIKPEDKKSTNKGLFIAIISLLTLIAILLTAVIFMLVGLKNLGKDDSKEPKTQTVELTQYNFYEYFTYEVTDVKYPMSNPYSNPYGEIVVTFYPLKNFEIENGQFDISIKSTDSSIRLSVDAYRTITQKIPFDGKFSITFNNWVEFDYWFKAANNKNITVDLSNVSGTITLK